MKIKRIEFESFLRLKTGGKFASDLPQDICAFVGANGCGKSILLEQIAWSPSSLICQSLQKIRKEISEFKSPFMPLTFRCETDHETHSLRYVDQPQNSIDNSYSPKAIPQGKVIYIPANRHFKPNTSNYVEDLNFNNRSDRLTVFDNRHAEQLEKILVSMSNKSIQASFHKIAPPEEVASLNRIQMAYSKVFPDIELKGALGSRFIAKKGSYVFTIDKLSHGEQQALILLSFIAKETNLDSSVLVVDEPETGLSAPIQRRLIPAIRELSPNLQIVLCSHSKEILATIEPTNIIPID